MEETPTPKNEEIETEVEAVETYDVEGSSRSIMRTSLIWAVMVVVAFALGAAAAYLIWVRPLQTQLSAAEDRAAVYEKQLTAAQVQVQQAEGTGQQQQQQEVTRYDISLDDDYILGKDSAEITIIEFSDYECPYCRRWHAEVFPQIREKYGDKVRFVYRDFPLYSIHPNAEPAAIAANCAGQQDQYYEYNELLYNGGKDLKPATYEAYAKDLGLNVDTFTACLSEPEHKAEVTADYEYAAELGVRSTPTFFINGLAVVGAQPFEIFEQIIDMELAGEIP